MAAGAGAYEESLLWRQPHYLGEGRHFVPEPGGNLIDDAGAGAKELPVGLPGPGPEGCGYRKEVSRVAASNCRGLSGEFDHAVVGITFGLEVEGKHACIVRSRDEPRKANRGWGYTTAGKDACTTVINFGRTLLESQKQSDTRPALKASETCISTAEVSDCFS